MLISEQAARARDAAGSELRPARAGSLLVLLMFVAVLGVTALAYWDEQRESASALDDFAREQSALAKGAALALRLRLASAADAHALRTEDALATLAPIERRGQVRVLLGPPKLAHLAGIDGRELTSPEIELGLASGSATARLSRSDAALLGLPARMAMAGLAIVDGGELGRWGVAIVSTAEHQRDRALRAKVRLVSAVVVAAGLVLAFGGLSLRRQRRQLELSHELEVAAVQRAKNERLVQADKLATLGALATGIAHEVSTPLGVILGRAEQLLPRFADDEKAQRAVDAIIVQTDRIKRVIRGFLDLARGATPRLEHVEPTAMARRASGLVEHRFEQASVALVLDLPTSTPLVACEPRLFEQVLVNLLLNACDACQPQGRVELAVRSDGSRVAFVVTDDGHGIDPQVASRVLEPFFTTKAEGQGSGLGLTIANEIVKHHNGTLRVSPREPGELSHQPFGGTRAVVEIPIAAS
jgi:signal transduction histidine kinase